MDYDNALHPGHRSIRLPFRDYSAPGSYFVTICAHRARCIFASATDVAIELTPLGQIVQQNWTNLPLHFAHVNSHAFVVMPNHVHGLIEIVRQAVAQRAAPLQATGDRWGPLADSPTGFSIGHPAVLQGVCDEAGESGIELENRDVAEKLF